MASYARTSTGECATLGAQIAYTDVSYSDGFWVFRFAPVLYRLRAVAWGREMAVLEAGAEEYAYPESSVYSSVTIAPPIEIVPVDMLAVSEQNRPFMVIQWYPVAGAHHYLVEYNSGSDWENHETVYENNTTGLHAVVTPILDDQTEAEWRVIAVDSNKRESYPMEAHRLVVRPPNPPGVLDLDCVDGVLTLDV